MVHTRFATVADQLSTTHDPGSAKRRLPLIETTTNSSQMIQPVATHAPRAWPGEPDDDRESDVGEASLDDSTFGGLGIAVCLSDPLASRAGSEGHFVAESGKSRTFSGAEVKPTPLEDPLQHTQSIGLPGDASPSVTPHSSISSNTSKRSIHRTSTSGVLDAVTATANEDLPANTVVAYAQSVGEPTMPCTGPGSWAIASEDATSGTFSGLGGQDNYIHTPPASIALGSAVGAWPGRPQAVPHENTNHAQHSSIESDSSSFKFNGKSASDDPIVRDGADQTSASFSTPIRMAAESQQSDLGRGGVYGVSPPRESADSTNWNQSMSQNACAGQSAISDVPAQCAHISPRAEVQPVPLLALPKSKTDVELPEISHQGVGYEPLPVEHNGPASEAGCHPTTYQPFLDDGSVPYIPTQRGRNVDLDDAPARSVAEAATPLLHGGPGTLSSDRRRAPSSVVSIKSGILGTGEATTIQREKMHPLVGTAQLRKAELDLEEELRYLAPHIRQQNSTSAVRSLPAQKPIGTVESNEPAAGTGATAPSQTSHFVEDMDQSASAERDTLADTPALRSPSSHSRDSGASRGTSRVPMIDRIRGEVKVIAGKVKHDDAKIAQGHALLSGQHD